MLMAEKVSKNQKNLLGSRLFAGIRSQKVLNTNHAHKTASLQSKKPSGLNAEG